MKIEVLRLEHALAELPSYASSGAAGLDLALAGQSVTIEPRQRVLLPTGICVAIPDGFEGQVRLRSGFARRSGCFMPNAPGTIDSDYRGEILILVMNASDQSVRIESGERFAQLIVSPVARVELIESKSLPPSQRAGGGFGSTGQ
ncbi:dUTP diphosphatase [bacterium]|nr:dUTP diphosphatase [bacterium]